MAEREGSVKVMDAPLTSAARHPFSDHDDRISFDASWEVYETLVDTIDDHSHILLAFDGERIELMSPGYTHEDFKMFAECLVRALTAELRLPCKGAGSTRWKRPKVKRGVEADATFYFTPEKILLAKKNRRSKNELDWPIPDVAIEIDISPSQLNRPGIYAALGVPEVWRFDGESFRIDRLGPEGVYADLPESAFLGLRAEEVSYLLLELAEKAEDDNDFSRLVTEWARAVLLPRRDNARDA